MVNLLIADDNYDFAKSVFNKIIDVKYINIVNLSSNGEEALQCILNKKVDIILLDLQMPVLNGIEMLKKLNELQNNEKMPKIIVTTGDRCLLSESLKNNLPIDYVFEKPFNLDELVYKIKDVCKDILYDTMSIRDKILEIIKRLEFNTSTLGYSYLIDCIAVCIESKQRTIFKVKCVYASIQNINDNYVSEQNVKWNIDKAIKNMINHTSKETLENFLKSNVIPTNKIIINRILDIFYEKYR